MLSSNRVINIIVLGGSMTAGVDCLDLKNNDEVKGKACAWPVRFQRWLQRAFPSATVNLKNLGRGGMQTEACPS